MTSWTPEQRKKFKATMARKKQEASRPSSIPLDAIPSRPPRAGGKPRRNILASILRMVADELERSDNAKGQST
jgi:hypothetical protein